MTASPYRLIRQLAIEALYEAETSGHPAEAAFRRRLLEERESTPSLRGEEWEKRGLAAIRGVLGLLPELDRYIQEAAPKYPVSTLAIVDRNILRLAIWELVSDNSAPVAAVINEAVELAHRYGGDSSPSFVNGVLRTVSERLRQRGEDPGSAGSTVPERETTTPTDPSQ
ncbi:MAG: N utilization substance protein B [Tepidiforma sp.]|uniref:Transcription antitermination protein NusB n=1 Tax=Tepidiforma bonchosmolovskayae TaxID=2601677 RepID=A0ABX6BYN1_9CHLR|nr:MULTISPECIES: transcription antitermination factor NusB [Tepidiforma]QFG02082.1 transcription antitermination factor NusB [Tepidiforma bonchosmolovskayae]GIW15958.1 MAG: N utilization substance protein B [Tepidiforma sp.]